MRQNHIAGEKLFVDYSGKKPSVVNRFTGEIIQVCEWYTPTVNLDYHIEVK